MDLRVAKVIDFKGIDIHSRMRCFERCHEITFHHPESKFLSAYNLKGALMLLRWCQCPREFHYQVDQRTFSVVLPSWKYDFKISHAGALYFTQMSFL